MEKINDVKVTRYVQDDEWYVDVIEGVNSDGHPAREAWLQHKDYGVSCMMYGLPMDEPREEFMQILRGHVEDPEMMRDWIALYWADIAALEDAAECVDE